MHRNTRRQKHDPDTSTDTSTHKHDADTKKHKGTETSTEIQGSTETQRDRNMSAEAKREMLLGREERGTDEKNIDPLPPFPPLATEKGEERQWVRDWMNPSEQARESKREIGITVRAMEVKLMRSN